MRPLARHPSDGVIIGRQTQGTSGILSNQAANIIGRRLHGLAGPGPSRAVVKASCLGPWLDTLIKTI